jgi:hypothetical protein
MVIPDEGNYGTNLSIANSGMVNGGFLGLSVEHATVQNAGSLSGNGAGAGIIGSGTLNNCGSPVLINS